MPAETAKEAAKAAIEVSGSGMWQWFAGSLSVVGAGIAGVWGHVTGRIKTLEEIAVSKKQLEDHTREENEKFAALFDKHDDLMREVTVVGKAVARIEGKLDQ